MAFIKTGDGGGEDKNTWTNSIDLLDSIGTQVAAPEDGWLQMANNPGKSGVVYVYDANGQSLGGVGGVAGFLCVVPIKKGMKMVVYSYALVDVATFKY